MSQERIAEKLICSTPIGRRPRSRLRTQWRDYVEDLSWFRLGIPAKHLTFVAEDRGAWRFQLELLPEYIEFVDILFQCVQTVLHG